MYTHYDFLCNSRSLVPIERFSQYFALHLVLIEHNVWRRERLLLNTAIFQLYYGQNKLLFNEIMMMIHHDKPSISVPV